MKAIFVDDEIVTIDLLYKIIDWEYFNIEIVGYAKNGEEAIELIQSKEPDIIITDIKMPIMDGIELIKWIRTNSYKARVVIISAYSEFEFAKAAIQFDVDGYILKPIDEEELEQLINQINKELSQVSFSQNGSGDKSDTIKNVLRMIFHSKRLTNLEIINLFKQNNIYSGMVSYYLLLLKFDNKIVHQTIKKRLDKINCLQEIEGYILEIFSGCSKKIYILENNFREYVIVIEHTSSIDIIDLSSRLDCKLKHNFANAPSIAISSHYTGIENVQRAFFEADEIMQSSFYSLDEGIVTYKTHTPFYNLDKSTKIKIIQKLIHYLILGTKKNLLQYIDVIFDKYIKDIKPDYAFNFIYELIVTSKQEIILRNNILEAETLLQEITFPFINESKNILDLKERFISLMEKIFDINTNINTCGYDIPIAKAIEYMNSNFNTNISLDDICKHVAMSKSYFCHLFKKKTGDSIWSYLTRLRMEKAKDLLDETNLKTCEVAFEVGYDTTSYFIKTFKQVTGETPQQYRKRLVGLETV